METMTIFVKEATAEKPIKALEDVLAQVPEIERALVDVENGEVKIDFDNNQISEEQIIKRIQVEGFHIE
ncbi:heavy-metal-associated domain-containing protein [Planococcus sp. CAU13]|uniref:heavy-metal-associated domain-containing protein n=1 Tax=Planococcus sp. CAU13 TaxID=1541197 RepID=UPI0005300B13|nr:heavy-metal-associated domain-containing protein [Planococcus sp. CAU13]